MVAAADIQYRRELARDLLLAVPLPLIRQQIRQQQSWARLFRGFRPQSVAGSVLLMSADQFAISSARLGELCSLYFDGVGTPSGTVNERALWAMNQDLTGHAHELSQRICTLLDVEQASQATDPGVFLATPEVEAFDSTIASPQALGEVELQPSPGGGFTPALDDLEGGITAPTENASLDYLASAIPLAWNPPNDHVDAVQKALTLFERSLMEFIQRQLRALHGDAWLRRGCGQFRDEWRRRGEDRQAVTPTTLLGYAHIGELSEIIRMRSNWRAFDAYFDSKDFLDLRFSEILAIRNAGDHAGQRTLDVLEQTAGLAAMAAVAKSYDPVTADRIGELFLEPFMLGAQEERQEAALSVPLLTNLQDFPVVRLLGRQQERSEIEEFWNDDFSRVLCITGPGGVGKTALLDSFVNSLLRKPLEGIRIPDAIIYLTAKDNYLDFMRKAPDAQQFRTIRRVFEVSLETLFGTDGKDLGMNNLRQTVLSEASESKVLFALDNLESLNDDEWETIREFLDDLPRPSKAIVTTREYRRVGKRLDLRGLALVDAEELIRGHLDELGLTLEGTDQVTVHRLVEYTNGVPLALVCCVNLVRDGLTLGEVLEQYQGKDTLDFLEFSFKSSLAKLEVDAVQICLFLALSKTSRSRRELLQFARDEDHFIKLMNNLLDVSFIRRNSEGKQIRFVIDNPQLRDYLAQQGSTALPSDSYRRVLGAANVLPAQVTSINVSVEIDRALARASTASSWAAAAQELEKARVQWGDDPRLLEQLGYYRFRLQDRRTARDLLETALASGYESSRAHLTLALVLFYERAFDLAHQHAELAVALGGGGGKAHQVAGQCVLAVVRRDQLVLGRDRQRELLGGALEHFERSVIPDPRSRSDEIHNAFSKSLLEDTTARLDALTMG